MKELEPLQLTDIERRALPTSLLTIFSKPIGDKRAAARMKFHLPKYDGVRVLNFGSRKPISKIALD